MSPQTKTPRRPPPASMKKTTPVPWTGVKLKAAAAPPAAASLLLGLLPLEPTRPSSSAASARSDSASVSSRTLVAVYVVCM